MTHGKHGATPNPGNPQSSSSQAGTHVRNWRGRMTSAPEFLCPFRSWIEKVVGPLDSLHTVDDGARVANDQVLMTMVSVCVLHERFQLA